MKLPPSLPILSAKVSSTGPTSVRKQDVRVRIGGQDVTLVLWGPGGRLYALPQTLLPKGEHAVEIIVQSPERGKVQARGQARIQVTY